MTIDKSILSIDSDDDDKNYLAFSEYLEDDTRRKRNLTAKEINEVGENLLKEIERKKRNQALKSQKLIPFILKHCDGPVVSFTSTIAPKGTISPAWLRTCSRRISSGRARNGVSAWAMTS